MARNIHKTLLKVLVLLVWRNKPYTGWSIVSIAETIRDARESKNQTKPSLQYKLYSKSIILLTLQYAQFNNDFHKHPSSSHSVI